MQDVSFYTLGLSNQAASYLNSLVASASWRAPGDGDPPIVVAWNYAAVVALLTAAAAVAVPAPFVIPAAPEAFCTALLNFISGQAPGSTVVESAVVACTILQCAQAAIAFGVLGHSPWAAAVYAHMGPAAAPIATLWVPRPRVTTGVCDRLLAAPATIFI